LIVIPPITIVIRTQPRKPINHVIPPIASIVEVEYNVGSTAGSTDLPPSNVSI